MSYWIFWIGNNTNKYLNYFSVGTYTKIKVFYLKYNVWSFISLITLDFKGGNDLLKRWDFGQKWLGRAFRKWKPEFATDNVELQNQKFLQSYMYVH